MRVVQPNGNINHHKARTPGIDIFKELTNIQMKSTFLIIGTCKIKTNMGLLLFLLKSIAKNNHQLQWEQDWSPETGR